MRSRLRIGILGLGLLALAGGPLLTAHAGAQVAERARVMVTNLKPIDDANKNFGRDLAKELRDLINRSPRHQPVDEDEVRDATKQYDIEYDDLDCTQSLQLANLVNAAIVFCGTSTENRDDRTFTLSGIQFAAPGGASLSIEDKTWSRDDPELAAQEIMGAFDTFVQQSLAADFCAQYFDSQDWDSAEDNCTEALEMNPDHAQVRFIYANVLRQTGRLQEAYTETLRVIELDPLHEGALQLAGFLAATLDMPDEAREHYSAYLVLNPGNAQVRMSIAYDLAQAGDPEGAMLLSEEGLAIEPDNVELLLRHAAFAVAAAQKLQTEAGGNAPLSPEAAQLYRKAQTSYQEAYAVQGVDMEFIHLRNMIATFRELDQLDEAIAMTEQVLETHQEEAQLWSDYANLLNRVERVEEAIAALEETEQRDPSFANVKARQGTWLIAVGREAEALPYLEEAIEKGEQSADNIANTVFAAAVEKGIQVQDWAYAIETMRMAKTFDAELSDGTRGRLDFYFAYSIYSQAVLQQEAQNLNSAQLTLPKFQEVRRLLGQAHVVASATESQGAQFQQLRDATQQYIEIQEAIIQRGRG